MSFVKGGGRAKKGASRGGTLTGPTRTRGFVSARSRANTRSIRTAAAAKAAGSASARVPDTGTSKRGAQQLGGNTVLPKGKRRRQAAVVAAERVVKSAGLANRSALTVLSEGEIRVGIKVAFTRMFSPPPSEWPGRGGTISRLRDITGSHHTTVKDVLQRVQAGIDLGVNVDVFGRLAGTGGFNVKIKLGTDACDQMIGGLMAGYGQTWTAAFVQEKLPPGTSCSQKDISNAVHRFNIKVNKRASQQTGKRDPEAPWSVNRLAICQQFRAQIQAGDLKAAALVSPMVAAAAPLAEEPASDAADAGDAALAPRYLDGTIFADEHCEYCVLGGAGHNGRAGNYEYQTPHHPNDPTVWLDPEDGGVYDAPSNETVPKYPAQASGIFSCAAPTMVAAGSFTRPDGSVLSWEAGERVAWAGAPLRYKGTVVGMAAFRKHRERAFAGARASIKTPGGRRSCWFKYSGANPYKERCDDPTSTWHGHSWEDHLPADVKKYVCITELIDNVIEQGTEMFRGSTREKDWVIYHDRLSQWWEVEAQAYIKSKGFADRQWRAAGSTNAKLSAYYKDSLMGDSPELMVSHSTKFTLAPVIQPVIVITLQ